MGLFSGFICQKTDKDIYIFEVHHFPMAVSMFGVEKQPRREIFKICKTSEGREDLQNI